MAAACSANLSKGSGIVAAPRLRGCSLDDIIPGLPDDLAFFCLARIPYVQCKLRCTVSKAWRKAVCCSNFLSVREKLGIQEELVVIYRPFPASPSSGQARIRRVVCELLDPKTAERALLPSPPCGYYNQYKFELAARGVHIVSCQYEYEEVHNQSFWHLDLRADRWRALPAPAGLMKKSQLSLQILPGEICYMRGWNCCGTGEAVEFTLDLRNLEAIWTEVRLAPNLEDEAPIVTVGNSAYFLPLCQKPPSSFDVDGKDVVEVQGHDLRRGLKVKSLSWMPTACASGILRRFLVGWDGQICIYVQQKRGVSSDESWANSPMVLWEPSVQRYWLESERLNDQPAGCLLRYNVARGTWHEHELERDADGSWSRLRKLMALIAQQRYLCVLVRDTDKVMEAPDLYIWDLGQWMGDRWQYECASSSGTESEKKLLSPERRLVAKLTSIYMPAQEDMYNGHVFWMQLAIVSI